LNITNSTQSDTPQVNLPILENPPEDDYDDN